MLRRSWPGDTWSSRASSSAGMRALRNIGKDLFDKRRLALGADMLFRLRHAGVQAGEEQQQLQGLDLIVPLLQRGRHIVELGENVLQLRGYAQNKGGAPWEQALEQKRQIDLDVVQQTGGAFRRSLQIQEDGEPVKIAQRAVQPGGFAYTRVDREISRMEGENGIRSLILQAAPSAVGNPDAMLRIDRMRAKRRRMDLQDLQPNPGEHGGSFRADAAAFRLHRGKTWCVGRPICPVRAAFRPSGLVAHRSASVSVSHY